MKKLILFEELNTIKFIEFSIINSSNIIITSKLICVDLLRKINESGTLNFSFRLSTLSNYYEICINTATVINAENKYMNFFAYKGSSEATDVKLLINYIY